MTHRIARKTKWITLIAVATAGGTVFSPCTSLFHDAAMYSAKAVVYTLLDPSLYSDAFTIESATTED